MAWTSPMTFVANTALTAAQLNTHLRDNMNETEVAKAESPGGWIMSTSATSVMEAKWVASRVYPPDSTTSTSYVDTLDQGTSGPTVTLTTGTSALVILTCQLYNTNSGTTANMAYRVSGATTVAATGARSLHWDRTNPAGFTNEAPYTHMQLSSVSHHTGLNAGVNTFRAQYRCATASTKAVFQCRRIMVFPT